MTERRVDGRARPSGRAVFSSPHGLSVQGNGVLAFLSQDAALLELRSPAIVDHLPRLESGEKGRFFQGFTQGDVTIWCYGIVCRITDLNRRPGVLGICVVIDAAETDIETPVAEAEKLFGQFADHYHSHLKGNATTEPLKFFPQAEADQDHGTFDTGPVTEVYIVDDLSEFACMEAGACRMSANADIGRFVWVDRSDAPLPRLNARLAKRFSDEWDAVARDRDLTTRPAHRPGQGQSMVRHVSAADSIDKIAAGLAALGGSIQSQMRNGPATFADGASTQGRALSRTDIGAHLDDFQRAIGHIRHLLDAPASRAVSASVDHAVPRRSAISSLQGRAAATGGFNLRLLVWSGLVFTAVLVVGLGSYALWRSISGPADPDQAQALTIQAEDVVAPVSDPVVPTAPAALDCSPSGVTLATKAICDRQGAPTE